jgi:hypothetical protein
VACGGLLGVGSSGFGSATRPPEPEPAPCPPAWLPSAVAHRGDSQLHRLSNRASNRQFAAAKRPFWLPGRSLSPQPPGCGRGRVCSTSPASGQWGCRPLPLQHQQCKPEVHAAGLAAELRHPPAPPPPPPPPPRAGCWRRTGGAGRPGRCSGGSSGVRARRRSAQATNSLRGNPSKSVPPRPRSSGTWAPARHS